MKDLKLYMMRAVHPVKNRSCRGKISAGAGAHNRELFRIQSVIRGMIRKPAKSVVHIVQSGRKREIRSLSVADGYNIHRQLLCEGCPHVIIRRASSHDKAAAVRSHDRDRIALRCSVQNRFKLRAIRIEMNPFSAELLFSVVLILHSGHKADFFHKLFK